jgi:hypothetical protein
VGGGGNWRGIWSKKNIIVIYIVGFEVFEVGLRGVGEAKRVRWWMREEKMEGRAAR